VGLPHGTRVRNFHDIPTCHTAAKIVTLSKCSYFVFSFWMCSPKFGEGEIVLFLSRSEVKVTLGFEVRHTC
jgi:hypothetical protein